MFFIKKRLRFGCRGNRRTLGDEAKRRGSLVKLIKAQRWCDTGITFSPQPLSSRSTNSSHRNTIKQQERESERESVWRCCKQFMKWTNLAGSLCPCCWGFEREDFFWGVKKSYNWDAFYYPEYPDSLLLNTNFFMTYFKQIFMIPTLALNNGLLKKRLKRSRFWICTSSRLTDF